MTLEEFRQQRRRLEKLKQGIPALYKDILEQYSRYKWKYEANKCLLDCLYYELENVKGVDYTREKGTYNNDARIEKYYKISDRIAEVEKETAFISSCLNGLETIKDSIQDKNIKALAIECYFNNVCL